jgi:hypothetical protein
LHVDNIEGLLKDYDPDIAKYMRYGWPINYNPKAPLPSSTLFNHKSAINYKHAVDDYVNKELDLNALAGPFDIPPFLIW